MFVLLTSPENINTHPMGPSTTSTWLYFTFTLTKGTSKCYWVLTTSAPLVN